MAYSLPENWRCINADHLFEGIEEISEINTALLMSLLDESQGDQEADNDRLTSIIQSLEEEIHHHEFELTIIPQEYDHQLKGQDDGLASVDTEFDWIDMEVMPSYNHITSSYMDLCDGDLEMDGIIQYSQLNWDTTVSLEENGCNSLWQQTYDSGSGMYS